MWFIKLVSISCVCPVIDQKFHHNIVKVLWIHEAIAECIHRLLWLQCLTTSTDYNVMMKFIVNNRTDAWKTDVNLFFTTTNCQITRSCSLTHCINYKFICLSTYWQWKLANEHARISAVSVKFQLPPLKNVLPSRCAVFMPYQLGTSFTRYCL